MQPYPNPNYFMQYQQPQYQQPNPYMQRMEQLQQFQQSLQPQNQSPALNTLSTIGKYVESIDIVKATDIPMDGNMYYFPKADGTEIYGKAWMQDGSPESKKKAMESLENYLKELSEDMTDLVEKMDANEKSMVRSKLQTLAQRVQ